MKDFFEILFYVGGGVLLWSKIGSIVLGLGVALYGAHKFNQLLKRTRLLREFANASNLE